MSDNPGGLKCCRQCRSLAARELRMLHARCYFAWCKREKVIYPGEREARLAPEGAYRGMDGNRSGGHGPNGTRERWNG